MDDCRKGGATPPPCDRDVYASGTLVMMTHTIGSQEMEKWVKKVAELSGQQVDWHWAGGRACVLALGDLTRVRAAIKEMMPEHDRLQTEAAMKYRLGKCFVAEVPPFKPSCTLYDEDECNPMHELARQTVLEREE